MIFSISHKDIPMSQDIVRDFERVSPELVKQAADFQAAILADVAGRRGALHGRIAALSPSMRFAPSSSRSSTRPSCRAPTPAGGAREPMPARITADRAIWIVSPRARLSTR